jgi:hypothetical protein
LREDAGWGQLGFALVFYIFKRCLPRFTFSDALCEIIFLPSMLKAALSAYTTPTFTTVLPHPSYTRSIAFLRKRSYIQPSIAPLVTSFLSYR